MSLIEKQGINAELSFLTRSTIAVFKDCYSTFADTIPLHVWKKDFNQFSKYVRTRGLGFICRDLPQLDDILLNGLKSGKVDFTRPIFGRGHKPKFLKGLWCRIFDENGLVLESADPNSILFIRQIALLGKKAKITRDSSKINKEKENGFLDTEKDLRPPTTRWLDFDLHGDDADAHTFFDFHRSRPEAGAFELLSEGISLCTSSIYSYLEEVCSVLFSEFDRIETHRVELLIDSSHYHAMKHGPGATHNTSRYTDKWDIQVVDEKADYLFNLFPTFALLYGHVPKRRLSSRMIFVPKDIKGPRLIAAEPIMNQYFQQAVFSFIKKHGLRYSGLEKVINFSRQDLSQDLARRGSIDGQLSTIDLKDASDRLSCFLVERVFRACPAFLRMLKATRTPYASFDGKDSILLKKYAAQGNATTFPIQSIVYAAIIIASKLYQDRIEVNKTSIRKAMANVRVFGDDLIVETKYYATVVQTIAALDLKVNEDKSFATGYFRESCGGDYYKGYDVTPIKIRRLLDNTAESNQMLIDVSNDAYRKGLWNLSDFMAQSFPYQNEEYNIPLVPMGNGLIQKGGLFTFGKIRNSHLRSRWDARLHQIQLKHWHQAVKTWRLKRKPLSRASEQQLRDISFPSWNAERIQRSQSLNRIGWL